MLVRVSVRVRVDFEVRARVLVDYWDDLSVRQTVKMVGPQSTQDSSLSLHGLGIQ